MGFNVLKYTSSIFVIFLQTLLIYILKYIKLNIYIELNIQYSIEF